MLARARIAGTRFDTPTGVGDTALVVDANPQALAATAQVLAGAGYMVSSASSFAAARRQLAAVRPDVLVTAGRLGGFSGLQLAIASRTQLPDLVAVVTRRRRQRAAG